MDKTNELELNRWAHELLGLCWHDVSWNYHTGKCQKCGEIVLYTWHGSTGNPNYCSSLDLAAKVEAKAIEMVGRERVALFLFYEMLCEIERLDMKPSKVVPFAPAITRVQAAMRAVEGK